jgi:hypothetical protein
MPFAERRPQTAWVPKLSMGIAQRFKEVAFIED